MKNKLIIALFLGAVILMSAPLPTPDTTSDGVLALPDPDLGKLVVVKARTVYDIFWEDLPGGGDNDFQDFYMRVQFFDQFGDGTFLGLALYFAEVSAYTHDVEIPAAAMTWVLDKNTREVWFAAAPGFLDIRMDVHNTGATYYTGNGERNRDGLAKAIVRDVTVYPPTVPEPSTYVLMGSAVGLLAIGRKLKGLRSHGTD